jgi:superfamily II RNA helicase
MRKIKVVLFLSLIVCPGSLLAQLTSLRQLIDDHAINSFNEYFLAFGNRNEQIRNRQLLVDTYSQNISLKDRQNAIQKFLNFLNSRQERRYAEKNTHINTMLLLANQELRSLTDEQEKLIRVTTNEAEDLDMVMVEALEETSPMEPRGWFSWFRR